MSPGREAPAFRREDGPTPEFVVWSLERACALREGLESQSPAIVARHLKSLAAIDHSQRAGWRLSGPSGLDLCLDPRSLDDGEALRGCLWNEVANFYGGADYCAQTCRECPANIRSQAFEDYPPLPQPISPQWAGCFGWLRRDVNVVQAVNRWLSEHADADWYMRFGVTTTLPSWNGLWMRTSMDGDWLNELVRMWDAVAESATSLDPAVRAELLDFCQALRAGGQAGLAMAVELVPQGWTRGTTWTIGPHCPRCKQAMSQDAGRCDCCGHAGRAHPPVHRKRLGYRPYLQLRGLVGSQPFDIIKRWTQSAVRDARLGLPRRP